MIKQSIITGLIAGLLLSLGLIYPTFALVVWPGHLDWFGTSGPNPVQLFGVDRPNPAQPFGVEGPNPAQPPGVSEPNPPQAPGTDGPNPKQTIGLIASTVISTLAVLLIGILPALRVRATRWRDGSKAGLLSGLVAGTVVFVIIASPANAWRASVPLFDFRSAAGLPPDPVLTAYMSQVLVAAFVRLLPLCLIAGAMAGWIEGGLVGLIRRNIGPRKPLALLDVIGQRAARRRWFASNDDAARGALWAGLLCGGLLALTTFSGFFSDLSNTSPHISSIVRDVVANLPGSREVLNNELYATLSPFSIIAVLGFGALAILFIKNPPSRFGSRFAAATMAGGIVGGVLFIGLLRTINVAIGLVRFPAYNALTIEEITSAKLWIDSPAITAAALFLAPLAIGFALIVAMSIVGMAQGLIYGWLLPIVFRRPIDCARPIERRLRREPDQVLPQVYAVYDRYWNAPDILPHIALALRRRRPDVARVIAAYHLSSTQADRIDEALMVMNDTLHAHSEWRWHTEIGSLYRILNEGLRARTLAQVIDIEPISIEQTSNLPPILSHTGEAISKVLAELKKLERVDDLNSKTIFLNNALESIRAGQRIAEAMRNRWLLVGRDGEQAIANLWRSDPNVQLVAERFKSIKDPHDVVPALRTLGKVDWRNKVKSTIELGQQMEDSERRMHRHFATSAIYPEEPALQQMLDNWQTLVMDAVKDLQGRAALTSELKTKRVSYATKLPITLTVRNDGLNVAEHVHVIVNDGEGYRVIDGGQQQLDLLTSENARDVEVTIEPLTHDRVRLVWQLVYDDAVNEQRQVDFADAIEFIETAAPAAAFVRIFPIPYVTGMPLKTNDLFVGREDVFAYIREHLLGAFQNNVIVLHGQRRTGKTSILYRLKDVLAETHICVLVDMQGKAARGTLDFLYSLADDIVYTLENNGITASLPPRSDFAESPEFVFRSRFLRGVYDVLPMEEPHRADAVEGAKTNGKKKHLLLMFDEFEELQKRVEDGKLEAEVFPFLRNLMQHEDLLDFVFAGTHKLEELGAEYWSILFNIASYNKITFLTRDDARRLITEPVAPNLEYDPLAIERIYGVTGGHPYFVQVVCHELVSYHNETQRVYLTANDVEEVLDRIVERGEAHFKFIWAESSPIEHSVLLALADILETDETSTIDQVQDLLDKRAIDLNGSALPKVLDNLEMGDILTRSSPRSSLYRFKIDLIRRWIYATRPV
jgi:hypothetical protein